MGFRSVLVAVLLLISGLATAPAHGFMGEGCADGKCTDCHQLTKVEAQQLLTGQLQKLTRGRAQAVVDARMSPVGGLWEVDVEMREGETTKVIPVYLDFSKKHIIAGNIIELEGLSNLSDERTVELNRIDAGTIPVDDAVVIGDPKAKHRIIVFDDPECPFCQKLHPEMKSVVKQRPDVAFHIKMLPLKMHGESARKKALAIICAKSAQLLDDSLAGKPLPEPTCETDQLEKNEQIATSIGVRSTPTLVLPDGRVLPGYKTADRILEVLDAPKAAAKP